MSAGVTTTGDWILLDNFSMDRQCHTKWCWAAVAEAVARCYNAPTPHTQRDIAKTLMPELTETELNEPCYHGLNGAQVEELRDLKCNKDQLLMSALLVTGCFDHPHPIPDGPAPLHDVTKWIDGGGPGRRHAVCVRIRWPNGRAHFVAITGYRKDKDTASLQVWDPWVAQSRILSYDELAQNYTSLDGNLAGPNLVGKWVDTHFTRRPAAQFAPIYRAA